MHNSSFVLITGASEGLGKALSLECARRHMNLVLVALPGNELEQLAQFIEKNYSVRAVPFGLDLTSREACYRLFMEINQRGIALHALINNAGIGGTHLFEEKDPDYYRRLIDLNVVAPTLLSHLFLPNLQQQKTSYILNVSSLAGCLCLPQKQVYGGTKSYLLSFSKSLRRELRKKRVFVSTLCPGGMNTTLQQVVQNRKLSGISRWSVMNPEDVACLAIDGLLQKKELIIPGLWNRVFILLERVIPKYITAWLMDRQLDRLSRVYKNSVLQQAC